MKLPIYCLRHLVSVKGTVHSPVNPIVIQVIVRVIASWVNGGECLVNMRVEVLAILIAIAMSFRVDSEHGQGWGPVDGRHRHGTLDVGPLSDQPRQLA